MKYTFLGAEVEFTDGVAKFRGGELYLMLWQDTYDAEWNYPPKNPTIVVSSHAKTPHAALKKLEKNAMKMFKGMATFLDYDIEE